MIKDTRKKRAPKAKPVTMEPRPSDATSENGRAKARKKRRSEMNAQVLQEFTALRNAVDLMVERYAIRVNGQLSELMLLIQGDGEVGQKPNGLTVGTANAILAEIRDVQLKPNKGRPKDFARLQRLVARLRELNPTEG